MNVRLIFLTTAMMTFCSHVAFAQSSDTDDPFRNNPFFSKPLDELLYPDKAEADTLQNNEDESITEEAKRYVRRVNNEGIDFGGALESGPYSSSSLYAAYPVLPMFHFNRVNGLFLGIRDERMQWYDQGFLFDVANLTPVGMLGYSFGQNEWQYEGGLERYIGFNDRIVVGASFYNATTTDDFWRTGLSETTVTSLFAGYDYLDYYKQRGWGAYLLGRTERFFEGGASYNVNRFNSLDQATGYQMFTRNDHYRPNPPIEIINGSEVDSIEVSSLTISAEFNPKQLLLTERFTFSLSGELELANPSLGASDYSYERFVGELITYLNIEPGAIIKYRLRAGSITGDAPLMKEFHLGGPGSLRAEAYKSYPNINAGLGANRVLLSNLEVQFGSTQGGSGWIDVEDLYLSLFIDSGWTSVHTGSNRSLTSGFEDFSFDQLLHSGGFGIGTNSVRAEIAWNLEQTSIAPILWIRLNPTF